MECPTCSIDLLMTDRQGVEIDYCPQCRGVWLDRGELDKIIERSLTVPPAARPKSDQLGRDEVRRDSPRHYDYDDDDDYRRRKRKSFLGEIFDF